MSLLPDNHVYSYSQLSSFAECPYGFFLERIDKVPKKNNAFAEQGSLIHDLIDQWAKGRISAELLPQEYERRYPDEVVTSWPRMLASKGYAEKTFLQGLEYFKNFDRFDGYEIIDTEEKFTTKIGGRPFTGIIDMILRDRKTGELIILDHKSKSLSAFRKEEKTIYRQQYMYAQYINEKYDVWPDRLMFNLFKEGGVKKDKPFDKAEFDQTIKWAIDIMEKIETFDVMDWLESKETSDFFCQELCSVRDSCFNSVPTK